MKSSIRGFLGLAVLGIFWLLPSRGGESFDIAQPQSPPRPAPAWLTTIDQGQNDLRLKGYFTPDGITVEIVADHPVVTNPVGMTFGDDGKLYVLEWRPDLDKKFTEHPETITYKDGSKRQIATMKKKVKDAVKVLSDSKGQGVYDEARVILEEELPSSILLHDGWLYVSGRGTVRRYRRSKPDGPYDVREVIAQGFSGFFHHQVSGMTIGNDGWLYVASADDDNYVEGSDGSRATVIRCGAIFRCRPDGSKMHLFALGFRNPYRDVAFDAAGNMFHLDNDQEDGSKFTGCRLMHVAEEADFGWRLRPGARAPDLLRGAVFGELPGKMPAMLKTGRGAPAGLFIYNDSRFPEKYRGLLLYADVFRKLIRAYRVEPRGATFAVVEEFEFLKSADPLFRPCQMVLGPDGAIYVCDWRTDSGGAARMWGDNMHGRIYRLRWTGTSSEPALPLRGLDSWAKIAELADDALLKTFASEDLSDRQRAQRELVRRGVKNPDETRKTLLQLLQDGDQPAPARVTALGALESFWNEAVADAFLELLRDGATNVRRLAVEGLARNGAPGDRKINETLIQNLEEKNPAVRRAIYLALGRIAGPGADDSLINAFKFEDPKDRYLFDGLLRAIERTGKPGIDKLVGLAESGVDSDREKVIEAFLALRGRAAGEALPRILKYPHLNGNERADLLRSYRNYALDPPLSLEPVLEYLLASPGETAPVKRAGLEVLSSARFFNEEQTRPRGLKLLLGLLEENNAELRLAAIEAIDKARMTEAAPQLIRMIGNAKRSLPERRALTRALAQLKDKSALTSLKELVANREGETPENSALRVEALRALATLDPAVADETARASLEGNDSALQKEAALVLGARPDGARLLGERFLAKKLPRSLLPEVSDALHKHAGKNPKLANLLTEVLKGGLLVSLDKAEVERVEELVRSKGNPKRGAAIFLDRKPLACISCHRLEGLGISVGPDLTRIWDSHSVAKIMESIIDPNKEIKEGYQTYAAFTKDGRTFVGLKVARTPEEVVLRDANARDIRIASADLDELVAGKSLMPENGIGQLTFGQFIDLVAFLKDRPAQEALRSTPLSYWVTGPFDEDLTAAYPPERGLETPGPYGAPKEDDPLGWQPRQADPYGFLNLRGLFKRDKISAYALTYVYSPKPQQVNLLLDTKNKAKIWVNSSMVYEHGTRRLADLNVQGVEAALQAGWNSVLVKIAGAGNDHGFDFHLRFAGGEGLQTALRPKGIR